MESLELFLLNQSIEQIQKLFRQSGTKEQQTILQYLEAIAKKLSAPEVHRPQSDILAEIRDAMEESALVYSSPIHLSVGIAPEMLSAYRNFIIGLIWISIIVACLWRCSLLETMDISMMKRCSSLNNTA